MSMRVFRYGKHAFSFEREKDIIFPGDRILQKFVPLERGKRSTFSLPERKSCKKKQAPLQVDGLSSMEATYRKAHSALRESTMLRHCYYSLGERVFRRSWFFGGL
jgi:hypothetical protein